MSVVTLSISNILNYIISSYLQEVELLSSSPEVLNFENCRELREVTLASVTTTTPRPHQCEANAESECKSERVLIIKGCDSLPAPVCARLMTGYSSTMCGR